MKFTKDEAYKELVAKLTAKGEALNLSERTAKKHLETLMKKLASDETELSAFMDEVFPDFKELDGQYRKDKADFIKQWNETHPESSPQIPPVIPPVGDKTELEKRLETLELELSNAKKTEKINGVRSSLLATMKAKGITDEQWSKDFISEINITEDLDVEAKAESFLKIFNKSNATIPPSITPHTPTYSNTSNNEFAAIKAEREKKLREQGLIKD